MNIVHIGRGTTPEEIDHIMSLRDAGNDVYVPGDSTGEQLVRRIIGAQEIHVWNADMVFELGMVYFYSVHALHYGTAWAIKVFCDPGDPALPVFTQQPSCVVQGRCNKCEHGCDKKDVTLSEPKSVRRGEAARKNGSV